jgi:thiamine-monophosphate kinase
LGEFGLIERLAAIAQQGQKASPHLIVGIGDDCAVWRVGDWVQLATTDTMVAGVHFLPNMPWRDVGWKIVAVNVSDIAAMGGTPSYGLATLGLPPGMPIAALEELYEGINEACTSYGLAVVGGDIVKADQAFVTLALIGEAALDASEQPMLMTRSAAKAGDAIAVTGCLGDSAAGLELLKTGRAKESPDDDYLARTHLRPQPRLEIGRRAVQVGVRCAIDVSDGLLQDVGHVCKASKLEARLYSEKLPLSPALKRILSEEALSLAASGGEDYELVLVAARPLLEALSSSSEVSITIIGEMTAGTPGRVSLLNARGEELTLTMGGWDHLRGSL